MPRYDVACGTCGATEERSMSFAEFDNFKANPPICPACELGICKVVVTRPAAYLEGFVQGSSDPRDLITDDPDRRPSGPKGPEAPKSDQSRRAFNKKMKARFAQRNERLDAMKKSGEMNVPAMEKLMRRYNVKKDY